MAKDKKIVVVYHGECPDGFSGAWAAWKKFGNKAEYVGASDRVNPPKGLAGKEVYFIDWMYPLATTLRLKKTVKKLVALDHHITVESATKAAHEYVYDRAHSGAVIAWRYFHPRRPLPKLFKNIEDYDLWRFKLPHTKEIGAFLALVPLNFSSWSRTISRAERSKSRNEIVRQGRLIIEYEKGIIRDIASSSRKVIFEKHRALAANCTALHSEVGHYLAEKHPPFSIVWREKKDGSTRVSLRSTNGFDVERFAKKYGGGGHKTAAGFSIPAGKKLPWKYEK